MINKEKICLIAGVGPGTGKECTKKFSNNGYKVAMLARNLEFLSKLEKEIPNTKAFKCDVGNTVSIINTCKKIKEQQQRNRTEDGNNDRSRGLCENI